MLSNTDNPDESVVLERSGDYTDPVDRTEVPLGKATRSIGLSEIPL
jgi:hypothetical protein